MHKLLLLCSYLSLVIVVVFVTCNICFGEKAICLAINKIMYEVYSKPIGNVVNLVVNEVRLSLICKIYEF